MSGWGSKKPWKEIYVVEVSNFCGWLLFYNLKILGIYMMMLFFNKNWAGACWNRWAGTGTVAGPVR